VLAKACLLPAESVISYSRPRPCVDGAGVRLLVFSCSSCFLSSKGRRAIGYKPESVSSYSRIFWSKLLNTRSRSSFQNSGVMKCGNLTLGFWSYVRPGRT
jgi:hypothetical protein